MRRAALFCFGALDAAEKGAISVALTKGHFAREARVLLARIAEARHDDVRARRWFARVLRDADIAGEPAVRVVAPSSDFFAWSASHAGFRAWGPSCMARATEASRPVALTADARVAIFGTSTGATLRGVPSRVLLDERALTASEFVCFNDAARATVTYGGALTIQLAPLAGPTQSLGVADPLSVDAFGFVGADGTAFLPRYLDNDKTAEWYRAKPGDKSARKIPFAVPRGAVVPLLLRDGTFLGFEGKADETMMLARFDSATGKRIEAVAKVRTGGSYVQTYDGTRLVYTTGDDLFVVDLAAKSGEMLPRDSFGRLVGLVGATTVVEQDQKEAVAEDLTTGERTWAGVIDHFERFDRSGRRLLALLPEDILAVDLASGAVTRYAIPTQVSGPDSSLRRSHAALSDDGSILVSGIGDQTTLYDVRDPAAPKAITTFAGRLVEASFAPGSSVARLFMGAPGGKRAYDAALRKEVPLGDGAIEERPLQIDRIAGLARLDPNTKVCAFDEATGTIALCARDYLALAHPANGRLEAVRLTFAFGRAGGMAIDERGYYDFFGDVPAWFRAAASCGDELPIEVCSDRLEEPGFLSKLLRGDLSYRGP